MDYVDNISVAGNAAGVAITYDIPAPESDNAIIFIFTSRSLAANRIEWSCRGGTMTNEFRPAACKA
jgi:hypothetical protein